MNEIGNVTKAMQADKNGSFYRVGSPTCPEGCCTPVYTADMEEDEGPSRPFVKPN
jgi:hypothetical protein